MIRETIQIGGREAAFESGEIARQAGGSTIVTWGDTVLLATITAGRSASHLNYMPLTVEYRWRLSAAGRIPGGYDRRESRPSDTETLTSRLIDRGIRPFFPDGWNCDTQLIIQPLSHDPECDPSVLGIAAASAALCLSDIPWDGPVAGVRIGLVDGELKAFPSPAELAAGGLDLIVSSSRDGIVMVEGGGDEIPEATLVKALDLARSEAAPLLDLCERLRGVGATKRTVAVPAGLEPALRASLEERVVALAEGLIREALAVDDKLARYRALDAAQGEVRSKIQSEEGGDLGGRETAVVQDTFEALKKRLIRRSILDGKRIGGRGPGDIREITGRHGWLKRSHGSSLFTRGETQAVVTCTLGTERDAKTTDTLEGREVSRFLLHYNFPPFSVGEVKPMRGPGRREIGHGNLARRALVPVLPSEAEAPYTIRLESLITESNGSSSMATVCGGTLALLDAGLNLKRPVAGIAMGLVKEGDEFSVLSDILGDEDHVGDMDFKVCGTEVGVTAIQMDSKLGALPDEVMSQALEQARTGRLHILARMKEILAGTKADLSPHAPRAATVKIEPNRIGGLVGSGGKTIKALQAELGISIDIQQDGTVRIYGSGAETMRTAVARVIDLAGVPTVGEVYEAQVVSVQPFGCFMRLLEGIDGLLPDAALSMGEKARVRVTGVNPKGKLVLKKE